MTLQLGQISQNLFCSNSISRRTALLWRHQKAWRSRRFCFMFELVELLLLVLFGRWVMIRTSGNRVKGDQTYHSATTVFIIQRIYFQSTLTIGEWPTKKVFCSLKLLNLKQSKWGQAVRCMFSGITNCICQQWIDQKKFKNGTIRTLLFIFILFVYQFEWQT